MHPDCTTGDPAFTPTQRQTLRAVLDLLVPANAQRSLPGAAELPQVLEHIERCAAGLSALREMLDTLQHEASVRHGAAFVALEHANRATVLDEVARRSPAAWQRLGQEIVAAYYQQDPVVERLGLEARAPFPKGYQVIAGDLTLLKPVIARGKIYRDAP